MLDSQLCPKFKCIPLTFNCSSLAPISGAEKMGQGIEILDLEQVCLANIFGERTPCNKLADLHPRQGNLLQRNNFSVVYQTSLHFAK
jgi:hypothetical protein